MSSPWQLIRSGKAYVCDHTPDEVDQMRGAPDRPGVPSAYRDRPIEESLDLFQRMRAGEFPDGAHTLRAKIDMGAPNVWLRDPILYRIRHASHHHTGDEWCIYPMYDFAHGLEDYVEGITHSLCSLEFEVHRPLYEWLLEALDLPRPAAAAARVRSPQRHLHRHEQAQAAPPGRGGARQWLGRPAHADPVGHAAARLSRPSRSAILRTA